MLKKKCGKDPREVWMADKEIKYEIVEHIATLSSDAKGWKKELNLVSWNGADPKYDIRAWSADNERMGKGITLSEEEAATLFNALKNRQK